MLVAVDAGKFATKAMASKEGDIKKAYFRTRCTELDSPMLSFDGRTFLVECGGKRFLLGEGAGSYDYDVSKTNERHKIAVLLSCALLGAGTVELVTGVPLSQFLNEDARKNHEDYLKGHYALKVNGDYKTVSVVDAKAVPETMGVVVQNAERYVNDAIGVIDIGGLNTNACVYDKLRTSKDTAFTINEGGIMLFAKIKRELNIQFLSNYQDYEIPYVMNRDDPEIQSIVNRVIVRHLNRIIEECRGYNWSADLPLVFTGGGSLLMEKQIVQHFPNANISTSAIWDNCAGYYRWGRMAWQK